MKGGVEGTRVTIVVLDDLAHAEHADRVLAAREREGQVLGPIERLGRGFLVVVMALSISKPPELALGRPAANARRAAGPGRRRRRGRRSRPPQGPPPARAARRRPASSRSGRAAGGSAAGAAASVRKNATTRCRPSACREHGLAPAAAHRVGLARHLLGRRGQLLGRRRVALRDLVDVRERPVDLRDARGLLRGGRRDFLDEVRRLPDRGHELSEELARAFGHLDRGRREARRSPWPRPGCARRACAPRSRPPRSPGRARPRAPPRSPRSTPAGSSGTRSPRRSRSSRRSSAWPRPCRRPSARSRPRRARPAQGHLLHLAAVLGVLRDRRAHLLERRRRLLHRGRLLARALRERLGRGRDLARGGRHLADDRDDLARGLRERVRARPHLGDHAAQALGHPAHRREELADLVAARGRDLHRRGRPRAIASVTLHGLEDRARHAAGEAHRERRAQRRSSRA